jgi:hypothetical protein
MPHLRIMEQAGVADGTMDVFLLEQHSRKALRPGVVCALSLFFSSVG